MLDLDAGDTLHRAGPLRLPHPQRQGLLAGHGPDQTAHRPKSENPLPRLHPGTQERLDATLGSASRAPPTQESDPQHIQRDLQDLLAQVSLGEQVGD